MGLSLISSAFMQKPPGRRLGESIAFSYPGVNAWAREKSFFSGLGSSQNILSPQRNDRRNHQHEEHHDQDERIDNPVTPGIQEIDVIAQIFGDLVGAMDFGNR